MVLSYNTQAKKRPINLSINSDLLDQAKTLGINLSSTFEEYLQERVRCERAKVWRSQNQEAIENYNHTIAEVGLFGDDVRSF